MQTTRFGKVEIDDSQVLTLPSGLLGFFQMSGISFCSMMKSQSLLFNGCTPWIRLTLLSSS